MHESSGGVQAYVMPHELQPEFVGAPGWRSATGNFCRSLREMPRIFVRAAVRISMETSEVGRPGAGMPENTAGNSRHAEFARVA